MKQLLFFHALLLLFACGQTYAQKQGQERIDSLLLELPKAKEDSNKVSILQNMSFVYSNSNPEEGIKYGEQGLALAQKLGWQKGIGKVYNSLGANYVSKSDYPKGLEYYSKAIHIYEEQGNKRLMANCYGNIGIVYLHQSDYPKSLEYLFKGLKINEESGSREGVANALVNIGTVYRQQGDLPKALEYFSKALKKQEELGVKASIAISLGNIGVVYYDQQNYTSALEYYLKSLKIMEELGNKNGIGRAMGNIASVLSSQRKYAGALKYYFKALKVEEEVGDRSSMANAMGNIGECYEYMANDTGAGKPVSASSSEKAGNLRRAVDYLSRSIAIFKETGNLDDLQSYSKKLSDAQAMLKDYKGALESQQQYVLYRDSVFSQENKIKIANLETRRDLDLKDRDITIKNKQLEIDKLAIAKTRNERSFFLVSIILIVGVVIIMFRNYKQISAHKNEVEKLKAVANERTRIASDMHDDLGSGLTSIRLLSEIANQKVGKDNIGKTEIEKIAKSAGQLSENLREIIWTINTRYDVLDDFIIYLRTYAVEYFDNTLISFQFNRPDVVPQVNMDGELRRNIFLCIKEALHNIVKHSRASEASLTFEVVENTLITTITDNGTGIDKDKINKFGNGLNTMKDRLKKYSSDLEIEGSNGTKLMFKINIISY